MIVFERRACAILYNLLLSLEDPRPFLLPANVCPIVPLTFRRAGRPFSLVDIGGPDPSMDPELCLDRLRGSREGFAGLLFVRAYGAEGDVDSFFRAAKGLRPDLLVIDDKCLCRPDCRGERVSAHADVTLFSTGRAKHVDLGFGGFAHLGADVPYRRHGGSYLEAALEEIERDVKCAVAHRVPFAGGDGDWLDLAEPALSWEAYQGSVRAQLHDVDEHKRRLNAIYAGALPRELQMSADLQDWRFNLRLPAPARCVERLFAAGLFASRHYASLGEIFCTERFPQAERLHQEIVNLFNDRSFDEERARRAVDCVLGHLDAEGRRGA
jgi:hypothetical protein